MDPVTGTIVAGLGSSLISGLFGSSAQKKANKTNIELQQKQLDWQERMSNSEWQRGVQDMKAAGLNPMLAFSQGGASTPNVSAARVEPEDAWSKAAHSAGQTAMQAMMLKQQEANIELTRAQAAKTTAEIPGVTTTSANAPAMQEAQLANLRAEYRNLLEREELTIQQRTQLEQLLPGMIRQQQEQLALTGAQVQDTSAAAQHKRAGLPEAEAAAKYWTEIAKHEGAGISGDIMLKTIMMIRSILR